MTSESGIIMVNAELASKWLATQQHNRNLSFKRVTWFVDLISRGEWQLTNDAISFDTCGHLINGQHRLTAITRISESVPLLVVHGLTDNAFLVMDTGQKRNPEQSLKLLGYANVDVLASGARLVMLYESGEIIRAASVRYTNDQIVGFVTDNPAITHWGSMAKGIRRHIPIAASAITAFALIALKIADDGDIAEFLEPIGSGTNLSEFDPRLALRRMVTKAYSDHSRDSHIQHLALLIKAFNAWSHGRPVDHFKFWKYSDAFPTMEFL